MSQEKDNPYFARFTFLLPRSEVHLDPRESSDLPCGNSPS